MEGDAYVVLLQEWTAEQEHEVQTFVVVVLFQKVLWTAVISLDQHQLLFQMLKNQNSVELRALLSGNRPFQTAQASLLGADLLQNSLQLEVYEVSCMGGYLLMKRVQVQEKW